MAVSSSAPLSIRDIRPLHLDDIGAYFSMVVKEIDIVQSTLSLEVSSYFACIFLDNAYMYLKCATILQLSDTIFDDLVCPLFGIYSRMQQTLLSISENDWRHRSVSVLNFLMERQAETLCERVSIYII